MVEEFRQRQVEGWPDAGSDGASPHRERPAQPAYDLNGPRCREPAGPGCVRGDRKRGPCDGEQAHPASRHAPTLRQHAPDVEQHLGWEDWDRFAS